MKKFITAGEKKEQDHTFQFELVYPADEDKKFKNKEGEENIKYLFHGSNASNWYSILRNGLKNCIMTFCYKRK